MPEHFCTENVSFEVVSFESVYHAILGHPAFAKFIARSCYIYNKLKMLGPKGGVITVQGDFALAKELELGNALCAERIIAKEELKELAKEVSPTEMPAGKETTKPAESFKASENTKKVVLDPKDPTKFVIVGTELTDKWENLTI